MDDTWKLESADAELLTVSAVIGGVTYEWKLSYADVDASNSVDLITSLRDFVTARRAELEAAATAPQIVQNAVGHSEAF